MLRPPSLFCQNENFWNILLPPNSEFLAIKIPFSRDGVVVICEETIWLHWQIMTCGSNQNIGIHMEYIFNITIFHGQRDWIFLFDALLNHVKWIETQKIMDELAAWADKNGWCW